MITPTPIAEHPSFAPKPRLVETSAEQIARLRQNLADYPVRQENAKGERF